ncbi:hypothetical protein [Neobacillus sp. YIM B06451]|uniref:YphA family membrane protein n=1 Tax=Neobacillus sp. YIM B06451 TaxID=3070994 RepID=UPI00292EAC83|nr:hypothetical protein [Neobacillus sp. YIM B06451]
MMEGYLYYLAAWLSWVYLVFLAGSRLRSMKGLQAAILLSIIASPIHFQAGDSRVFLGGISIFLYSLIHIVRENGKEKAYFIVCSFTMSLLYCSISFFELFDPVVFIIKKEWFLASVLALLVPILYGPLKWRLLVAVIGMVQGEILYALVLQKNSLPFEAGGFAFLDTMSLVAAVTVSWSVIERCSAWLGSSLKPIEKGRKSSR